MEVVEVGQAEDVARLVDERLPAVVDVPAVVAERDGVADLRGTDADAVAGPGRQVGEIGVPLFFEPTM